MNGRRGPLCQNSNSRNVADGTNCLSPSLVPGPTGAKTQSVREGNPGKYYGRKQVNFIINGVFHTGIFHIIEAIEGTWLSAATRKHGWGEVYGPKDGYGAYVKGVIRREDGSFISGVSADQIKPGELFAIKVFMGDPIRTGEKRKKLTPEAKKKLADLLAKEFELSGERLKTLTTVLDIIDYVDTAASLAEIAGLIGESGVIAGAATGVSMATVFLFPVGAITALVNAFEGGEKMYGMRGIAYTITAFAFDDKPVPTGSLEMRRRADSNEKQRYDEAWKKARSSALRTLEQTAREQKVSIASYKAFLRAMGEDNRQKLCRSILEGLEGELKGRNPSMLISWRSNYKLEYPK